MITDRGTDLLSFVKNIRKDGKIIDPTKLLRTFLTRPSLKMTALSYSCTMRMQKKMVRGKVRTMSRTEKAMSTTSHTPPMALLSSW